MSDPFYIQWHLTNHCNLRCKHCYQGDFSKKEDLDWTGLLEISEDLLPTMMEWGRTTCIHLTGGGTPPEARGVSAPSRGEPKA